MDKNNLDKIVRLRANLIGRYDKLRDYKNNNGALMKEVDHAKLLHAIIVELDNILSEHVKFA
jgi:hypothetical protein